MRDAIYRLIGAEDNKSKELYDAFIMFVALFSLLPMTFKQDTPLLSMIDTVTVYILFFDYILRWLIYDKTSGKKAPWAFLRYPVTPFALMDLISLLPSLGLVEKSLRIMRIMRVFKVLHYSKSYRRITAVFKKQFKTLMSVLILALGYIFISALVMYTYEPDTFQTFFHAMYWATTALTTVGYGDLYPVTEIGRLISMISSLFGIAVIALPAGIVTGGYIEEMNEEAERKRTNRGETDELPAFQNTEALKLSEMQKQKLGVYAAVIALSLLLNFAGSRLAEANGWPAWLDITGTVLASIALEPAAGLLVGFVDNFYLAVFVTKDATSIVYYLVSVAVAICAGVTIRKNGKLRWQRLPLAMLLVAVSASALATLLSLASGDLVPTSNAWEHAWFAALTARGMPDVVACFGAMLGVKLVDVFAAGAATGALRLAAPKIFNDNQERKQ